MGFDLAYFIASSDAEAVSAQQRDGGPLGWSEVQGYKKVGLFRKAPIVVELGPAFTGFATRGYDPIVMMATLESILTEKPYDEVIANPRSGGSPDDSDAVPDRAVLTLTDSLRDSLAAANDERLRETVALWVQTEEFGIGWSDVTADEHFEFLRQLRNLAREAKQSGQRMYCYYQ